MRQTPPFITPPEVARQLEDTSLRIRGDLADTLPRLAPEQWKPFLDQFAIEVKRAREQVESYFVPIWGVHKAIITFGEGVWHDDLRDILFFIYKRGDIKGELKPEDVIRLIDSIGPEEIIRSVKANSRKGIRLSQIAKIRKVSEFIVRQRSELSRR
jgi:hypothetical protein